MTAARTLSKSQYLKGLQCPKRLWYSRHRKDLTPETDAATQARFDTGDKIGALAQQYFQDGELVSNEYWDIQGAIDSTRHFIKQGYIAIFEATAAHPVTGAYGRIDILQKTDDGKAWNLIEVKSSTSVKDYHIADIAFQYHVFNGAGYNIRGCYMMLIDKTYVRNGGIDPQALFCFEDVTSQVLGQQDETEYWATQLGYVLAQKREPSVDIGARCFAPFECEFRHHCWRHVPGYSIFNVINKAKAERLAQHINSYDILKIPPEKMPGGRKAIDIACYREDRLNIDIKNLQEFLQTLEYPLYFLDYETVMSALPVYDGTSPYQQIPFQFSLHIQDAPDGETRHLEYLHTEYTDPRVPLAEKLIEACGKKGSIIVYNQSFEINRNKEIAEDFPDYTDDMLALNTRVIDIMAPFQKRWLYQPSQHSSHSIKAVLPAFVPDLSYDGMTISNGGTAMDQYLCFLQGQMSPEEQNKLWDSLSKYCELDTYAMVELLRVIREYAHNQ